MIYDVTHVPGCWGCEQSGETDWEVLHCPCCIEQWKDQQ